MPTQSAHPPIVVPPVDLWTFIFERTNRPFPDDHVVFIDIAAKTQYTFRDVHESAEKFGRGLRHFWNWQKGDVLATFTPNSADVGPVTFGAGWAGGVICPFNNLYTVGELASQLQSSGAKALVTHVACLSTALKAARKAGLPDNRILLVGEKDPSGKIQHFSDLESTERGVQKVVIDPKEDLAFLVYSSGTTGLPKGVMLTHENMVANIMQNDTMDGQKTNWKDDRNIGFLPMFHIYGLAVLVLLPVYRGICVSIMQRFDLEQFCQVIQEHKITMAYVVPPVVLLLAKHPIVEKYNLKSLRMMHSSAAPLTEDLVKMNHKRLGVPIKQGYGLSECSPGVATQAWESWDKPIGSAGNLLPSLSIKFMDSEGKKEVPTGSEGEIWLAGPNIFKGYWRNPSATAESITPDGYYRTGDIGYIDSSKNIYITDRVKELIKYNGFQVAPAQLEGLLLGHPAVNDVAVIGVYSERRATELPRAYVVAAQGVKTGKKLEGEVSDWLHGKVAPYKRLRGGIIWVDEIPKSAAGKVLRRVLSERAKKEESEKPIAARL